jgi:predicted DNA-binding transcriptional regulator AlpA
MRDIPTAPAIVRSIDEYAPDRSVAAPDRFVDRAYLRNTLGITLTRQTLWKLTRAGLFPSPVRVGEQKSCYVLSEVISWMRNCRRTVQPRTITKTKKAATRPQARRAGKERAKAGATPIARPEGPSAVRKGA